MLFRSGVRIAQRPQGAGAQLLLLALLARAGVAPGELNFVKPACPTGSDIAQAVRSGRADCGIASRSAAVAAGLDFVPLSWEYFDLVVRQRDFFLPPFQTLFGFLHSTALRDHAGDLGRLRHRHDRPGPPRQLTRNRQLPLKPAA